MFDKITFQYYKNINRLYLLLQKLSGRPDDKNSANSTTDNNYPVYI